MKELSLFKRMSETWMQVRQEPYRVLFPVGIASAFVGIGIWIPYWMWPDVFPYPGFSHPVIQIQGFLLSFIFGFLCTMLPKVLGVSPLGPWQFVVFPAGIVGIMGASLASAPRTAQVFHLLLTLNFIFFIARRLPEKRGNIPSTFAFIALAMGADLLGTILRVLFVGGPVFRIGTLLQYQAFPLLLIFGVGGFLLPKLFGAETLNLETIRLLTPPKKAIRASLTGGLIFLFSYGIEVWGAYPQGIRAAYAIRAGVWIWFLVCTLRLHRKMPGLPGYLVGARIALFAIGLGLTLPVFIPAYLMAWEHLIFITGFLLLTLSVASRVLTAHGGRLEVLLNNRKKTWAFLALTVLAVATRISTDIWTGGHRLHLALASVFAVAAITIWARMYLPLAKVLPKPKH